VIAAVWLGVGAQAGFPVGSIVVQLFLQVFEELVYYFCLKLTQRKQQDRRF